MEDTLADYPERRESFDILRERPQWGKPHRTTGEALYRAMDSTAARLLEELPRGIGIREDYFSCTMFEEQRAPPGQYLALILKWNENVDPEDEWTFETVISPPLYRYSLAHACRGDYRAPYSTWIYLCQTEDDMEGLQAAMTHYISEAGRLTVECHYERQPVAA